MLNSKVLLKIDNLSLGYEGKSVVDDVSFVLFERDYLCIVGENGSGKSTLMKTLLGLVDPLAGEILEGENFHRNEIGYLPQQTLVQRDFPASVYEIVMSGFLNSLGRRFFYTKEQKRIALENMQKIGIEDLKNRSYRELSGGQQQRVLLARALSATKKLLLLDEPTNGLDSNTRREFYSIIEKLNKEEGIAIIMISHDIDESLNYASNVLHIDSSSTVWMRKDDYLKYRDGGEIL